MNYTVPRRSRRIFAARLIGLFAAVALLTFGVGAVAAQAVVPPSVSGFLNGVGPTTGGNIEDILGSGFTGTTSVHFGTASASFTVVADFDVQVIVPPGTGIVHVTVTTPAGSSTTTGSDQYVYVPVPAVTSISPATGSTAGGTAVTITGTGFDDVDTVTFGGQDASFNVNSDSSITATSPPGTGTVDITLSAFRISSAITPADQFSYVAPPVPVPTVSSISPASGSTAGGTTVTITGTGFDDVDTVTFGGQNASFSLNSDSSITATSPPGTGTVDIALSSVGIPSVDTPADQFTYVAPPTVTSVSPDQGTALGGTVVTITGTGFISATSVTIGGKAVASFTVESDTSITATTPAGTAGATDVVVSNVGGGSIAATFTYDPVLATTGVDPSAGMFAALILLLAGGGVLVARRRMRA